MSTIETVLLSLLVLDAVALTVLVMIQQGKGADVGAAFGSGSSSTMFGSAGGAPFLTKLTAWLAIGFFVIAFGLAYTAKEKADAAGTLGIPTAGPDSTPDLPADLVTDIPQPLEGATNSAESEGDLPVLDADLTEALEQVIEDVENEASAAVEESTE